MYGLSVFNKRLIKTNNTMKRQSETDTFQMEIHSKHIAYRFFVLLEKRENENGREGEGGGVKKRMRAKVNVLP